MRRRQCVGFKSPQCTALEERKPHREPPFCLWVVVNSWLSAHFKTVERVSGGYWRLGMEWRCQRYMDLKKKIMGKTGIHTLTSVKQSYPFMNICITHGRFHATAGKLSSWQSLYDLEGYTDYCLIPLRSLLILALGKACTVAYTTYHPPSPRKLVSRLWQNLQRRQNLEAEFCWSWRKWEISWTLHRFG